MPAMVDREIGCFKQVYKTSKTVASNDTYTYSLGTVETQVGRKFDYYSTFADLSVDYPGNPAPGANRSIHKDISDAAAAGHGIFIGFQVIAGYFDDGTGTYRPKYATFDSIMAGTYDAKLDNFADYLATLNVPIILRHLWEANLPGSAFYPDNSTTNHPGFSGTYQAGKFWTDTGLAICTSMPNYIACFQYIVTRFRARFAAVSKSAAFKSAYIPGANDPSVQVALGSSGTTFVNMYPGDAYVDYVGYDSYNTLSVSKYFTPEETVKGYRESDSTNRFAYDLFQTLAPTKKMIIGEINCLDIGDTNTSTPGAAVANGHSKADWYTAFWNLDATVAPNVEKIMWFNEPGTRSTWPFTSSSDALTAFSNGFQFGGTGTFHGVVPDPIDPGSDTAPDPSPAVTFPLSTTFVAGQTGHAAVHNKLHWIIDRVVKQVGSYFGLNVGSDGTQAALTTTVEMGSSFIPAHSFITPVDVSGNVKYLFGSKTVGDTNSRWGKRTDGLEVYYPPGGATADLRHYRSAAGTFSVRGASDADTAHVNAYSIDARQTYLTDVATPASPGAGGIVVYSRGSALGVRNATQNFALVPSRAKTLYPTTDFSGEIAGQSAPGGTNGPTLAVGIMYVARIPVQDARNITRIQYWINSVGMSLTNCYMGLYDSTGTLLQSTADLSSVWTGTAGFKSATITTQAVTPGTYYIAGLVGGAVATPRFVGLTNGVANWNITVFGTTGSGLTALPSTFTVGTLNGTPNEPLWAIA